MFTTVQKVQMLVSLDDSIRLYAAYADQLDEHTDYYAEKLEQTKALRAKVQNLITGEEL